MTPAPDLDLSSVFVQEIDDPLFSDAGVNLSVLRLDRVHPVISGNKWFKLKYNLIRAAEQGIDTLLSFGGPWSNHLHALAAAGEMFGFKTVGIVRGSLGSTLTPCLSDAAAAGMTLHGVSRSAYREKHQSEFIEHLKRRYGDFLLIPEGGANAEGARGCAEIADLYDESRFDLVCLACGTGTTLAGLAGVSGKELMGFQVLKGKNYLRDEVHSALDNYGINPSCRWSVNDEFHCGGFGKTGNELMRFITNFEGSAGIPLEPVYSGKMLLGLNILIKRDFFPQNSRILAIHGGGLQGRRGYI